MHGTSELAPNGPDRRDSGVTGALPSVRGPHLGGNCIGDGPVQVRDHPVHRVRAARVIGNSSTPPPEAVGINPLSLSCSCRECCRRCRRYRCCSSQTKRTTICISDQRPLHDSGHICNSCSALCSFLPWCDRVICSCHPPHPLYHCNRRMRRRSRKKKKDMFVIPGLLGLPAKDDKG